MTNMSDLVDSVEWDLSQGSRIPEPVWRTLLAESQRLADEIAAAETWGKPTTHLWESAREVRRLLRDPRMKVEGFNYERAKRAVTESPPCS